MLRKNFTEDDGFDGFDTAMIELNGREAVCGIDTYDNVVFIQFTDNLPLEVYWTKTGQDISKIKRKMDDAYLFSIGFLPEK